MFSSSISTSIQQPAPDLYPRLVVNSVQRSRGILTQLFSIARSHLVLLADPSRLCVLASRLCLAFTALLLVVSPWTEYHCDWDRFLQGGQDLEFGLLAVALVLCLVLLLSQRGSPRLLALWACVRVRRSCADSGRGVLFAQTSPRQALDLPRHPLYALPLQV